MRRHQDSRQNRLFNDSDVSTENEDHQTVFDANEKCIDTVLEFDLQTDQGKFLDCNMRQISVCITLTHLLKITRSSRVELDELHKVVLPWPGS
jgi:hypothetical protein